MTAPLFVNPAARQEIEGARSWYDNISASLGNDFGRAIAKAIKLIRRHPLLYVNIGNGLHRAVVRRFSYQVFYRISNERVTILAIYHSPTDRGTVIDQTSRRLAPQ